MKKTKLTRSLLAACSIVALSVVLSGCLHSSGGGPAYSELDLMGYDTADGATVEAGTYSTDGLPTGLASALEGYTGPTTAGAGEMLTIGGYTFTCGADSSCSVTVAPDGSHFTTTGTITVAKMATTTTPEPDTTTPTSTDVDANMALAMAIDTADDATADTTDDAALLNLDTAVALVSNGKPADNSELTESDMVIADLGTGWSGSAYGKTTAAEGTTPASSDTVVIYNNKGADETVGYLTHYGVAANLPTGVTLTAATGVMAFEANSLGSHPGLVTLMDVTKVTKYDSTVGDATDNDGVGSTVEGTFQGIAGLFTCTDYGPHQTRPGPASIRHGRSC